MAHLLLVSSWFLVGSTQHICSSHSQLLSSSVLMLLGPEMTWPAFLPDCHSYNHHAYICVSHTLFFSYVLFFHSVIYILRKISKCPSFPYIASSWTVEVFVSSFSSGKLKKKLASPFRFTTQATYQYYVLPGLTVRVSPIAIKRILITETILHISPFLISLCCFENDKIYALI